MSKKNDRLSKSGKSDKTSKSGKTGKSGKTSKSLKKLNCSPIKYTINQKKDLQNISCYSNSGLLKIINKWNLRHPDRKFLDKDPVKIWNFLKQEYSDSCDNEMCWLRQKFIENDNKDLIRHFSPKSPEIWKEKPNTWLDSRDISKLMKQYENSHKNFKFIGPSPIDFEHRYNDNQCVWDDLCNFDLNNYIKKNITKIGIIFNTDKHNQPGSHWISLFIDINNKFIFYFDSNGNNVSNEITNFIEKVQEQANKTNINLEYTNNVNFRHQMGDGQCGIFALHFIIELLLENKKPEYFKTHRITDKEMREYRLKYYN